MRPRTEEIFVKIVRTGFISQLGMCGPIPNPIKITRAKAHSLIVAGIDVYQYFPENQFTEKLTLQTVFGTPEKVEEKKVVTQVKNDPIKPVALTGVKKEIEDPVEEDVEEEVVEEVESEEVEETEEETPTTTTNTPNNNNNNNYSKKNKKKHK